MTQVVKRLRKSPPMGSWPDARRRVYEEVAKYGTKPVTNRELEVELQKQEPDAGWYRSPISGATSVLHRDGYLAVVERKGNESGYVLMEHRNGRRNLPRATRSKKHEHCCPEHCGDQYQG
jgi:uncharacterized protein YcaQ